MKKSLLTSHLKNLKKDLLKANLGDLTFKNMEEVQTPEVVETTEVPTPEVEVAPEVAEEVAE